MADATFAKTTTRSGASQARSTAPKNDMVQQSTAFLLNLLEGAIEEENKRVDDVHATVIDGRYKFQDTESGSVFAMIDRVLEPAGNRYLIDQIVSELKSRLPDEAPPLASPPRTRKRCCRA